MVSLDSRSLSLPLPAQSDLSLAACKADPGCGSSGLSTLPLAGLKGRAAHVLPTAAEVARAAVLALPCLGKRHKWGLWHASLCVCACVRVQLAAAAHGGAQLHRAASATGEESHAFSQGRHGPASRAWLLRPEGWRLAQEGCLCLAVSFSSLFPSPPLGRGAAKPLNKISGPSPDIRVVAGERKEDREKEKRTKHAET